jgi:hypothetical protein
MRLSIICEAELDVRELSNCDVVFSFLGLRNADLATALRGFAAFARARLAAAFFATFTDFLKVIFAIAFTPGMNS